METAHHVVAAHYDLRGEKALAVADPRFGSERAFLHVSEPYRAFERLLRDLRKPEGSRLLDLCCGTGVHSILPAKLDWSVVGIDLSEDSIRAARWLAATNGVADRCEFLAGDALEWRPQLGTFDLVFTSGSLYYLDFDRACHVIDKYLNDNGHFICIETNGDNQLMGMVRRAKALRYKHRDEQTLRGLLGRSALRRLERAFAGSEVRYFDFATLAGMVVEQQGLGRFYHQTASALDRWLLNHVPGADRLAFKFMFHGRKLRH